MSCSRGLCCLILCHFDCLVSLAGQSSTTCSTLGGSFKRLIGSFCFERCLSHFQMYLVDILCPEIIPVCVFLLSVRSFGTEGRPTDRPAPPRDEIYEYIIFRGSDIKDITVCEPPKLHHNLPQDPAIVQVCKGLKMLLVPLHDTHQHGRHPHGMP